MNLKNGKNPMWSVNTGRESVWKVEEAVGWAEVLF